VSARYTIVTMGPMLSQPVMSTIVERKALANGFRIGLAEMNGWRNKMEDAHVVHMREDWGFFAVFDGHGGDQCAAYVAKKFYAQLEEHGCPVDDEDVKRIVFDIDRQFLDERIGSGSTAAMCIVHRPSAPGGKMRLRLINAGDSRVLLGKRDGTIVDGGGTDEGLSTDHKPDHPSEKERIYRCGGTVETPSQGGPARVNGSLAVSRGFGDAEYKKTGGPGPQERPVTVDPELRDFECDEADFLVIVCDGVSEGDFSNSEVVRLIADEVNENGDLGAAAKAVIFKAEQKHSKDNITCMIVMFNGSDNAEDRMEFIPGPIQSDGKFLEAYEVMAKRAGMTLGQAVSLRLDNITEEIGNTGTTEEKREKLKQEATLIGEPPGAKDSDERREWFGSWQANRDGCIGQEDERERLMRMLSAGILPRQDNADEREAAPDGRRVRCPDRETLFQAVIDHPELSWEDRMEDLANAEGIVKVEDEKDGTMQVRFASVSVVAWLPTSILTVLDGEPIAESLSASGGYLGSEAPKATDN